MEQHDVVIAGGGPAGLMLAAELALAGVRAVIVERRATQDVAGSRAGGLHARTIELLDQRGVADRFLAQGQVMRAVPFAMISLDLSDAPTRHPYWLALWQEKIERTLRAWVDELRVPILRACEVTGFAQDDAGVDVTLSDSRTLRARWLVGCDGGRSLVRKQAGIDFPGADASLSYLIAEATMPGEPPFGARHDARGIHAIARLGDGGRVRVVTVEPEVRHGDPTLDDLRAAITAIWGSDLGVRDVTFLSRFTDATRQAAAYRAGRVLLAGDAAHVHSPAGGQGLNLGVHDAVNLGWKLALVARGHAPPSLLDSYDAERRPVTARILETTMAITALQRGDVRTIALRERMSELIALDEPRRRYAAMMAGLDIRLDLAQDPGAHPLVGRRVPDLALVTREGPQRTFALLHRARPVLLTLDDAHADRARVAAPWADRVAHVHARTDDAWTLPVIGDVPPPAAVLVRPDGHVAWVAGDAALDLRAALTMNVGPPPA